MSDALATAAELVPLAMTLASLAIVATEWVWLARRGQVARPREGWVNVGSAVLNFIPLFALNVLLTTDLMAWLHAHRVAELGRSWWVWLLAWLAYDLGNYALHLAEHKVRVLWCIHQVHHQPEEMKASVSFRGSWTEWLVMPWLVLWLPIFGFEPELVLVVEGLAMLWGVLLHLSEHVAPDESGPLGRALRRVFITPQAHRLHHARDGLYLDTNYGLCFSLWDRLFGTWQDRSPDLPPTYGLTRRVEHERLWVAQMDAWQHLLADLHTARGAREVLGFLFLPPGWTPDGTGRMAHQIRREARAAAR